MALLKRPAPVFLLCCTLLFVACGNKSANSEATKTANVDSIIQSSLPPAAPDDSSWPQENGLYAVFSTPKGKIVARLEYTKAPMTVGNFVALSEGTHPMATINKGKPFYDGLTFFNNIGPGYLLQGGDPNGDGTGNPGYLFPNEIDSSLKNSQAGTLAMANAGPNTNGSQIYITLQPIPKLDGQYNVFGYVVAGQNVLATIAKGDKIDSVRIVRVGQAAKAFNAVSSFAVYYQKAKKKLDDALAANKSAWDTKVRAKFPNARKTPSGLYYVIDKQGTGALATKGQTVTAHYTGTFWDGKKFDSSLDRGQPFSFVIGQGQVIQGWDEGFGLLKVGTKGKLIIPYYLAYGENGNPGGIPPKSDLIFDVEMIGVK